MGNEVSEVIFESDLMVCSFECRFDVNFQWY